MSEMQWEEVSQKIFSKSYNELNDLQKGRVRLESRDLTSDYGYYPELDTPEFHELRDSILIEMQATDSRRGIYKGRRIGIDATKLMLADSNELDRILGIEKEE